MPVQAERGRKSILVVEDDPVTRTALVHVLELLGYEVVPVATVAESIERLDGQHCAVLDLNLPDGLGTTILRRIRTENRPIRVAVVSATTDRAMLDEARDLRAELILRKPINVNELIEWVSRGG